MEEEVRFGKNAHQERLLGFGLGYLYNACYWNFHFFFLRQHLNLTAPFFLSSLSDQNIREQKALVVNFWKCEESVCPFWLLSRHTCSLRFLWQFTEVNVLCLYSYWGWLMHTIQCNEGLGRELSNVSAPMSSQEISSLPKLIKQWKPAL